jgi:tRNA (cmo5U34)-methyltransferase
MNKNDNLTAHPANEYDNQVRKTIPYYDSFHQQIIELVKILKPIPELWLDTGGGTGTFMEKALQVFTSTKFLLSDPSDAMLEIAKDKLKLIPLNRLAILSPATTQNIQWEEKSLDIITAIQSHHYLSDEERIKTTKHCYNLLNDGGVYVTFENTSYETPKGTETALKIWQTYQLAQGKPEVEVIKHINRYGIEFFPITVKQHLDLLKECGFSVVELFWFSYMQAGFFAIK